MKTCAYSLEVPQRGVFKEYLQHMFLRRNKKNYSKLSPNSQSHSGYYIYPEFANTLTFTTLWAFSADDKLMIFFLIFPSKLDLTFHANCLLFLGKIRKIFQNVVC